MSNVRYKLTILHLGSVIRKMDCSETNAVWYQDEKTDKFNQEQSLEELAKSDNQGQQTTPLITQQATLKRCTTK